MMKMKHVISAGLFGVSLFGVAAAQNFGPSLSAGPEAAKLAGTALLIPAQLAGQTLASDLIGTRVYGRSGQELGVVRDLLLDSDGRMDGLLVSVGGVLGIGAKMIGVPYRIANIVRSEDGRMTGVRVSLSKADAENAATFRGREGGSPIGTGTLEAMPVRASTSTSQP